MEMEGRNHLGLKIKTISKLMMQNMTNSITTLDLTSSQAFLLGYLCHRQSETVYPKDLEKEFGFTHPTVSGLLQRLEAKGFILCKPSPADRRFKCIQVTDKALRINQQILGQMQASETDLVSGFTMGEITQLHQFLDRMIQNITPSSEEGGTHP